MSCECVDQSNCQCHVPLTFDSSKAIIIQFPALVKSSISKTGKRIIEFECSNEEQGTDLEGDLITQKALLKSKDSFLQKGTIDRDHYSELGRLPEYAWLGIRDPDEWIIGKATQVNDLGEGRTGLVAELFENPLYKSGKKSRSEEVWESLVNGDIWLSSVYGYPGPDTEVNACTIGALGKQVCAERYLVHSFKWKSTALTKNPINTGIKYSAKVITAKSFAAHLRPDMLVPFPDNEKIFSRTDIKQVFHNHLLKSCPSTENGKVLTVWAVRDHFLKCECLTYNNADLYALATAKLMADE